MPKLNYIGSLMMMTAFGLTMLKLWLNKNFPKAGIMIYDRYQNLLIWRQLKGHRWSLLMPPFGPNVSQVSSNNYLTINWYASH